MRIRACPADELGDGEMKLVEGGPEPIALYRVEGAFYATSDTCSHGQASLCEDGELDGFQIECSWHFGRFDIRSGDAVQLPCYVPIRTFPVSLEDGFVFVEVSES